MHVFRSIDFSFFESCFDLYYFCSSPLTRNFLAMLAAAQANIPPELRQRLEVVAGSVKPLGLTGFGKDNKPTVKFLTFPSGMG